jgi:hypothetical protein
MAVCYGRLAAIALEIHHVCWSKSGSTGALSASLGDIGKLVYKESNWKHVAFEAGENVFKTVQPLSKNSRLDLSSVDVSIKFERTVASLT